MTIATAHSFLPPSGAAAWVNCAMWPTMNKLYPQENTPETLEGNAAHWVAWEMLAGRFHNIGIATPNGVAVTEEMIEGGELVCEVIGEKLKHGSHIERRVAIPRIHKDCFGTPDAWGFDSATFVLDVLDYKFGHRFVDEFENWQGVSYIAGILEELAVELKIPLGQLDQLVTVNFTVIQPRCFYKGRPVRTWTVRAEQLRGQLNRLEGAAQNATVFLGVAPLATTNPECGDCPGRHACATLQKAAYSDAEFAVASVPVELSPQAAGLELSMLERAYARIEARVEGLREQVKADIKRGAQVPMWGVEQQYGRTKWTRPDTEIIAFGKLMGKDLSKSSVKTPGQAEKLGIDGAVIKAYTITPPGEIKLVPNTTSNAARVFGRGI